MSPHSSIIDEKCGCWEDGALKEGGWIGCDYLRAAIAPLSKLHELADALHGSGLLYFGETAGPFGCPHGIGRTYDEDGRPFVQGRFVDGVLQFNDCRIISADEEEKKQTSSES